ncbi:MAG TPA: SMP-30/gluconolactonase/LRE family protein [Solirubrobacteraceae bacterium]|nr:SMP-30/gluconolactonase/LRE family protein [Solirubrobacteraceae bacterium]
MSLGLSCVVAIAGGFALDSVVAIGVAHGANTATGASTPISTRASSEPVSLGLSSPLLISGAPDEGAMRGAEEAARRANPESVATRIASAAAFANLTNAQAVAVAKSAFPTTIDEPAGGPPKLPAGQHIVAFLNEHVAQIALPSGQSGLVASNAPIATPTSNGFAPVSLALQPRGGGFGVANSPTEVELPNHVSAGVQLPQLPGLSLTPVDTSGTPLTGGGDGVEDGATVLYPNTGQDTDTAFKPTTSGADVLSILRSSASPTSLNYAVGLPAGAKLVQNPLTEAIRIEAEGTTVAEIPRPVARDAAGDTIPTSTTVAGGTVTVSVTVPTGIAQYPIAVDPELKLIGEYLIPGLWHEEETPSGNYTAYLGGTPLALDHHGAFSPDDWGILATQSKGLSKIYAINLRVGLDPTYGPVGNGYQVATYSYLEAYEALTSGGVIWFSGNPTTEEALLCATPQCDGSGGSAENAAVFELNTVESSTAWEQRGEYPQVAFGGTVDNASVYYSQPSTLHSTVTLNKAANISYESSEKKLEVQPNLLYGGGRWLGPRSEGVFEFKSADTGLGVAETNVERKEPNGTWHTFDWHEYFAHSEGCIGLLCSANQQDVIGWGALYWALPNGEDPIRVSAHDEMAASSSAEHGEGEATLKVDSEPPYSLSVGGLPSNGEVLELGEVEGQLTAEATDGKSGTPSSGLKSLTLAVDGKVFGNPSGSCAAGPCTATGHWSISGADLGAGVHTLTVLATDNANNYSEKTFKLIVSHASPLTLGPGSVNPESGDYAVEESDVNESGGLGSLTVSRHYDSRNPTEGTSGPLGPQWTIGLDSLARLEVLPDKSVLSIGSSGLTHFSLLAGGGYEAPEGDKNLKLRAEEGGSKEVIAYYLEDPTAGTSTKYTLPSGTEQWMPTASDGPAATDTITAEYATSEPEPGKKIVQPTLEVAPHPTATCTVKHLEKGCRALEFVYTSAATTASGENRSQWGKYKGRLERVIFIAYNPSTKAMAEKVVAQYEYDGQGRLRAEWNPSVSSTLKTTYGYDPEGHLTAITPAGQQPWVFTYGATAGSRSTGDLLKTMRPPASTSLWNGEAVKNTEAPQLSGTPVAENTLGVSAGKWSNSPAAYGYQWQDCNTAGAECVAIPGANNANYTLKESDAQHVVRAEVMATNADGTVVALAATSSSVLGAATPTYSSEVETAGYTGYQITGVTGLAQDSSGNIWESDSSLLGNTNRDRVQAFTEAGIPFRTFGAFGTGNGEFSKAAGIAVDSQGVYVLDSPDWRVEQFNANGEYLRQFGTKGSGPGSFLGPKAIAVDAHGNVWVADSENHRIEEFSATGQYLAEIAGMGVPDGIAFSHEAQGENYIYVADQQTGQVDQYAEASHTLLRRFGSAGAEFGQLQEPMGLSVDSRGRVWVVDRGNHRVEEFSSSGTPLTQFGVKGTGTGQVEAATSIVVTMHSGLATAWLGEGQGGARIEKWTEPSVTAGVQYTTPAPGYTVDYGVPVSGTGAPHQLGAKEVEGWGQHDDPTYATAIFPPDEPESWPAKDYRRATISYLDSQGRLVNVASPAGGIATSEFNAENDVVRSLSPDNRATALNEANPAEAAKRLDSESVYNVQGQLLETRGPQHLVKLAAGKERPGEEVTARNHVKYHYDEGAPTGESYSLVTKVEDAAEASSGEEFDKRTTLSSYGGQGALGWTLRKPTSTTVDPAGLDRVTKTFYDPSTGDVVETRRPGGNSETVYPPAFASEFGSEGSGNGQFKDPAGIGIDASGNLWVADKGNGRIQKFSASGTFIASYGTKGAGNLQFNEPWGVAINAATGNVYVSDDLNNRVQELSSSGAYVRSFGTTGAGTLHEPAGLAIDSSGDVWVSDGGDGRIVEFSAEGAYIREVGAPGSGNGQLKSPGGLALSEGSIYVADAGNSRIEQFSSTGEYLGQFGSKGTGAGQFGEPYEIAANPSTGVLYVADPWNRRVEEFSPAGRFLAEWETSGPTHPESAPFGLAVASTGRIYLSDIYASKVSTWTPPETGAAHLSYNSQFGSSGSGSGQFSYPVGAATDGEGNVWVTDCDDARVEKFSAKESFLASYGSSGSGNDQFNCPTGIDINKSTGNVYVADLFNHRVEELSSTGAFVRTFGTSGSGKLASPTGVQVDSSGNVWVADMEANRVVEFSSTGTYITAFGATGSGNGQLKRPTSVAVSGEHVYVGDTENHRVDEFSTTGTFIRHFGLEGEGSGELYEPGIAVDSAGNLYVIDGYAGHVEEFNSSGGYLATFGTRGSGEGQLNGPTGLTLDAAGDMYVVDAGDNRVEKWTNNNPAVHYSQTIYYTAGSEAAVATCRSHPEWVGLPCQTQPAAQPKTTGLPELPVTTITYNMWDQGESVVETFGAVKRTRTTSFDGGGRPLSTEQTSTSDTALPTITDTYNATNGSLETQSTTTAGITKTITSNENTLGELESYKDADGNQAKYTYDEDGRPTAITDGSASGEGKQTYGYDETSGALTKLVASGAGTFTASYDVEGQLSSEVYPDGLTAYYTYNSVDAATGLEYKKTTHCAEKCTWFSDAIVPSIHGEAMRQTSTLSEESSYAYDATGRLTQVQETPASEGCSVRTYSYDEEGDRTSLSTRKPGTEGKCATEGGATEPHVYDSAGRLADAGVAYEAFGNPTALPASDAGGSEAGEMTSSYYVDSQLLRQTQGGETHEYLLDPEERTRETISSGKTAGTVISHYDSTGSHVAWTSESGNKWTRNIQGIDGELAAVQASGGSTVLQLHDLQGNVVATAGTSETETKLLSTYDSTEFGVPKTGTTPPKYAWKGALGVETEQSSSGLVTQDGVTYVPQLGTPLQPPADLSPATPTNAAIPFVSTLSAAVAEFAARTAAEGVARREQEIREREAALLPAGEISDPINHYRAWQAKEISASLARLGAAGDLTGQLGTLFGNLADYVDGYIEARLTAEVAIDWIEEYGQFLGGCVLYLQNAKDSHGGCRASYDDIGPLPDFWKKPEISVCLAGKPSGTAIDGLALGDCELLGYSSELPAGARA